MFSRGKSGRGRQGGRDPAHDRVLPWQASQRQIYYREDPEFRKQPRGLLEDGSRWRGSTSEEFLATSPPGRRRRPTRGRPISS